MQSSQQTPIAHAKLDNNSHSHETLAGRTTISKLLLMVFLVGLVVSSLAVYSTFVAYRISAVRDMAKAEGQRISHLVFEHFYSVMRKGATRAEIDDLVHHIQNQLPNYEVTIIRGEPVARQFGDRPGQVSLRHDDPDLRNALSSGDEYSGIQGMNLRHLFPIKVTGECMACHTQANLGEINGVIAVSVPLLSLEAPIVNLAYPIMALALCLVITLLAITFWTLRKRVSQPITELAEHVSDTSRETDYARDLTVNKSWPLEVRGLANNFNDLMGQVRDSHKQLREISLRDPLTGLFNRRHFDCVVEQAIVDAQNGGPRFAVLLIDLDKFKPINDRYGHAAGDAILISVSKALQASLRETDTAARIGGDEFAIVALTENYAEADELAARLRTAVEATSLRFGHQHINASCSIGVSHFHESGHRAEDLLHAADVAMYSDKKTRCRARS